jgi:hypothetical protein
MLEKESLFHAEIGDVPWPLNRDMLEKESLFHA